MTDGGLQNLGEAFKKVKSLEEITLSFTSYCFLKELLINFEKMSTN